MAAHIKQGGAPVAHALTIGQLAKATGVAAKTIRFYEQIGVLPTPNRTEAGYRQLGLPLRDVKTVIVGLDGGPRLAVRPRLLALVRRQLSAVQHRSSELGLLQRQLEQVLHRLLTSPRERSREGCRCLDTESVGERQPHGRVARTRAQLKGPGERALR